MAEEKALYRRWRPQVFADLVGQNHVKQTLLNAIKTGKVSHAYLFAGPRGTGKTSMARLLAKAVNCLAIKEGEPCGKCQNCFALTEGRMMDLIEIDAASHTSVEDVRSLIEKINFTPSVSKYKVYIIDEVHMLSKSAFNALLKTLEEPPAHAIFILATTEVHKLLPTVVSRCQYFDFHYLTHAEVTEQLKKIVKQEKIDVDDEALLMIVDNAEGSLRDALSVLEQAASFGEGTINQRVLKDLLGVVDVKVIGELTQAVLDKDALAGINLINEIYFKGYDINQLGKLWLSYLRELLMIKLGNENLVQRSTDTKKVMAKQAQRISVGGLVNLLQNLVGSINSYRVASLPQLALELVVAKASEGSEITIKEVKPLSSDSSAQIDTLLTNQPSVTKSPSRSTLKPEELVDIKTKLLKLVASASPAVGAVFKGSRFNWENDKLCIYLPSKFLKETLEKANNRTLLIECLAQAGVSGTEIEYRVEETTDPVKEVAGVFDIM